MVNKRIAPFSHIFIFIILASNLMMSACEPGQLFDLTTIPVLTPSNPPVSILTITHPSAQTPIATTSSFLPIGLGTPLPLSNPILEANIDQIQVIASIPENPDRIYRISSDHRLLFIADTHGINVYNISTQTLEKHLPFGIIFNTAPHGIDPSGFNESHFSISASGNILATIDFEGVKVISLEGEILFSSPLEMPFSPDLSPRTVPTSYSLALSPDGSYLALYSSTDGIEVIQLADGRPIDTAGLRGSYPRFSPSGNILVTMTDNQLEFWNTADWSKIQDIPYRGYWPLFTFVNDSTILLHNWSNSLELWDIIHQKRIRVINLEGDRHKSIILAQPLISPSGEYFAVLKRDTELPCFELSPITVTVFNLDGEILSEQTTPFESRNCKPYFLGLAYVSSPIFLTDSAEAITFLPPSNDDYWGTILKEMDISISQKTLPESVLPYLQDNWKDFGYDFEMSPDGRQVALALRKDASNAMEILDVSDNETLYWGSAAFTSGCFSLDSTLFAMNLWDTIKIIDMSSPFNLEAETIFSDQQLVPDAPMSISPDHQLLAAVIAKDAMSETIGFIKINDGTLIYQWRVGNDEIKNISFSENGKYLIIVTYAGWIDILGIYP